jgi:hypothetical protein
MLGEAEKRLLRFGYVWLGHCTDVYTWNINILSFDILECDKIKHSTRLSRASPRHALQLSLHPVRLDGHVVEANDKLALSPFSGSELPAQQCIRETILKPFQGNF